MKPALLRWGRESAGLSVEEASRRLGLSEAKLEALESGERDPTQAQLERAAKEYRRPLVAFYMAAPPRRTDRGQDFRNLPSDQPGGDEVILDALLRDLRSRQTLLRALFEEEEERAPIPFIGSLAAAAETAAMVAGLRSIIGVGLSELRAAPSPDAAFDLLRDAAEAAGVIVILVGDLGSHHTAIGLETFRGIALADQIAPLVAINDHDSRAAWSFTLLHELAHLALGQTGVSGLWSDLAIERLCNDAASEFLLPDEELARAAFPRVNPADAIRQFAQLRNLSGTMVAYRLYRSGRIGAADWERLRATFRDHWFAQQAARRSRRRPDQGGPDYYTVRRHRLGSTLVDFVGRMMRSGALTTVKAARVLGVKPAIVHSLVEGRRATAPESGGARP